MKRKGKCIEIPVELFTNLVKYHIGGIHEVEPEIIEALYEKSEAMEKHTLYTKYKTTADENEKEEARMKYLEKKRIPEEFRW